MNMKIKYFSKLDMWVSVFTSLISVYFLDALFSWDST